MKKTTDIPHKARKSLDEYVQLVSDLDSDRKCLRAKDCNIQSRSKLAVGIAAASHFVSRIKSFRSWCLAPAIRALHDSEAGRENTIAVLSWARLDQDAVSDVSLVIIVPRVVTYLPCKLCREAVKCLEVKYLTMS